MAFDDRICALGEGPLWHPERAQFFWFDILGHRLLTPGAEWQFDAPVSAAGWLDEDHLLVAGQRGLMRLNLETGARETIAPLEAERDDTRSNDGRADPQGGFWIGTMHMRAPQTHAGAIYRYCRGELRLLFDGIAIPNATCFAPDGKTAYFADTLERVIWRVALDAHGWPAEPREVHIDLRAEALNPDGAVVAQDGTLWVALWGAGRVEGFDMTGARVGRITLPAPHLTCPAFGGPDLSQMLITSATQDLTPSELAAAPDSGKTFLHPTALTGQAEHRVIL